MKIKYSGKQTDLAKKILLNRQDGTVSPISHIYLNAVFKERRMPSIQLALKIEEATNGEIKAVDLRPDLKEIVRKVSNL